MPELPEVETIRLGLQKYLVGKKLEKVEVKLPKIFEGDPTFIEKSKVIGVRRFGKVLVIDFDSLYSLAIHVKLTGQLVYLGEDRPKNIKISSKVGTLPGSFTHVIFHLSEGARLFYNDIRRFGWLRVLKTSEVEKMKFIHELGPEPFAGLTLDKFKKIVEGRATAIKVLIMDQKRIGGIGNIYANDALYLAKIDPRRSSKSLSEAELEDLFGHIISVLKKGLELGGSSENTYVNALGEEGEYQKHMLVYARAGKNCPICGTKIRRITLGGRGTFFCEECQK